MMALAGGFHLAFVAWWELSAHSIMAHTGQWVLTVRVWVGGVLGWGNAGNAHYTVCAFASGKGFHLAHSARWKLFSLAIAHSV